MHARNGFKQVISDYYFDSIWHFDENFVLNFIDIAKDIVWIPITPSSSDYLA